MAVPYGVAEQCYTNSIPRRTTYVQGHTPVSSTAPDERHLRTVKNPLLYIRIPSPSTMFVTVIFERVNWLIDNSRYRDDMAIYTMLNILALLFKMLARSVG